MVEQSKSSKKSSKIIKLTSTSNLATAVVKSRLSHGINAAEYNPKTGVFALKPQQLTSSQRFALQTVTITESTFQNFAGHQALMLVPLPESRNCFIFLELPAEIRNIIYKLILSKKGHDIVVKGTSLGLNRAKYRTSGWRNGAWAIATSKTVPKDTFVTGANILRTNKQINQEATPLLYRSSTFRSDRFDRLEMFLSGIGANCKFIQRIDFTGRDHFMLQHSTPTIRKILSRATSLKEFVAEAPDDWAPGRTTGLNHARNVGDTMGKHVACLTAMPDTSREAYRLLDVLTFSSDAPTCTGCVAIKKMEPRQRTSCTVCVVNREHVRRTLEASFAAAVERGAPKPPKGFCDYCHHYHP